MFASTITTLNIEKPLLLDRICDGLIPKVAFTRIYEATIILLLLLT